MPRRTNHAAAVLIRRHRGDEEGRYVRLSTHHPLRQSRQLGKQAVSPAFGLASAEGQISMPRPQCHALAPRFHFKFVEPAITRGLGHRERQNILIAQVFLDRLEDLGGSPLGSFKARPPVSSARRVSPASVRFSSCAWCSLNSGSRCRIVFEGA